MKIWFITGTSRGFGREWAKAALERGDKVAATARNINSLQDLVAQHGDNILPLALDVTDHAADVAAVKTAWEHFGHLDVIVNNAGYGQFGAIEELSEAEVRAQMETNFFGALWITQAALPYLRQQGHGHIIQVSSIAGVVAFTNTGAYHASKWALEGFSDSLSQEVARFGIHVTLIEPGGFDTDFAGDSSFRAAPQPQYDLMREQRKAGAATMKRGNPAATSDALFRVVDDPHPPLRLLLGEFATQIVPQTYDKRLKTWADWTAVARAADGK